MRRPLLAQWHRDESEGTEHVYRSTFFNRLPHPYSDT